MKNTHTVMSARVRKQVDTPEFSRCSLQGIHTTMIGECAGRITREHAMIYGNKKIQEAWAIIPLCAKHHGVDIFQDAHTEAPKRMREWVALSRATIEELAVYTKANYWKERCRLAMQFGKYEPPAISPSMLAIHY